MNESNNDETQGEYDDLSNLRDYLEDVAAHSADDDGMVNVSLTLEEVEWILDRIDEAKGES